MLSSKLKRAFEVMNEASAGNERPKTYAEFLKQVVPEADQFFEHVYVRLKYNGEKMHWIMPNTCYKVMRKYYQENPMHFGGGSFYDCGTMTFWNEVAKKSITDPVDILEIVYANKKNDVDFNGYELFWDECKDDESSSSDEEEEEEDNESPTNV